MTNDGTFRMRIQLKADSEANWIAHPIVPLANELIIYTADNTHHYARLKVGDGTTSVTALPFIDSGTLDGHETEIVKLATFSNFPSPGSNDKLYVDLSTSRIYHYTPASGYSQLSNFGFSTTTSSVGNIVSWMPGVAAQARVENNILKITNGALPELLWKKTEVVTEVTKGE